jgi:hypothetical protein
VVVVGDVTVVPGETGAVVAAGCAPSNAATTSKVAMKSRDAHSTVF